MLLTGSLLSSSEFCMSFSAAPVLLTGSFCIRTTTTNLLMITMNQASQLPSFLSHCRKPNGSMDYGTAKRSASNRTATQASRSWINCKRAFSSRLLPGTIILPSSKVPYRKKQATGISDHASKEGVRSDFILCCTLSHKPSPPPPPPLPPPRPVPSVACRTELLCVMLCKAPYCAVLDHRAGV